MVASEAVDISLIVLSRRDLSSLSGVRLPSLSSPKSSSRSRDRAFSRSREGVRDRSGFFRVSLLGESVTSKSLLDPDGDKESGKKVTTSHYRTNFVSHEALLVGKGPMNRQGLLLFRAFNELNS